MSSLSASWSERVIAEFDGSNQVGLFVRLSKNLPGGSSKRVKSEV